MGELHYEIMLQWPDKPVQENPEYKNRSLYFIQNEDIISRVLFESDIPWTHLLNPLNTFNMSMSTALMITIATNLSFLQSSESS